MAQDLIVVSPESAQVFASVGGSGGVGLHVVAASSRAHKSVCHNPGPTPRARARAQACKQNGPALARPCARSTGHLMLRYCFVGASKSAEVDAGVSRCRLADLFMCHHLVECALEAALQFTCVCRPMFADLFMCHHLVERALEAAPRFTGMCCVFRNLSSHRRGRGIGRSMLGWSLNTLRTAHCASSLV